MLKQESRETKNLAVVPIETCLKPQLSNVAYFGSIENISSVVTCCITWNIDFRAYIVSGQEQISSVTKINNNFNLSAELSQPPNADVCLIYFIYLIYGFHLDAHLKSLLAQYLARNKSLRKQFINSIKDWNTFKRDIKFE